MVVELPINTAASYMFSALLVVGTSRCDVPGRVQRAERTSQDLRAAAHVAPLYAARTAQRAVPTTPNTPVVLGWLGKAACMLAAASLWFSAGTFLGLAAPAIPPGVPEPGLILWGSVVNATNPAQTLAISSVSWSVTDGAKTAVYSGQTRPATRIVTLAGKNYYVLEVPFDTRRFGSVTLADPATQGLDSFELKTSSPPTYTLTPTINGVLATVQSVDGAPA